MANRLFTSQFNYSFERQPVSLMGSFIQSGSAGVAASRVINGITYTAVTFGSAGNSITIAIIAGGTAGSEVVSVVGKAISIQVESGVSTRTQVATAITGSAAASALISTSVASGATAATLSSALALQSGTDAVFTSTAKNMTMTQVGTGLYQISFPNAFAAMLDCSITIFSATASDLKAQISVDQSSLASNPNMRFRINAVATPTNMASGQGVYVRLEFRNSGS